MPTTTLCSFLGVCAALVLPPLAAAQCQVVKLHSPDPSAFDWFGSGVAIDGDRLLVGAERDDPAGSNAGAACIFRRDTRGTALDPRDDTWTLESTILPSIAANQQFGTEVALDGDTALIGSPSSTSLPSIAYIHHRDDAGTPSDPSDDTWPLQDTLHPPASPGLDSFGSAVALGGDYALVGDPRAFQTAVYAPGAAYVFWRDDAGTPADPADDTWPLHARLDPIRGTPSQRFGKDVALSGDRILVGAPVDGAGGPLAGAAYVFQLDEGGTPALPDDDVWVETAKLLSPEPAPGGNLGFRVALHGDTAVLSSKHGATAPSFLGTAFLFRLDPSGTLSAAAGEVHSATVGSIDMGLAFDGENLLVGDAFDGELASEAGAARVFAIEQAPWSWLGQGLAGAAGTPCLFGAGPLTTGSPYTISVHDGAPASLATLILGGTPLTAPFKGGVLVPSPDRLFALPLDAQGAAGVSATWLGGLPSGFELLLQAWMPDVTAPQGFAATNALSVTVP